MIPETFPERGDASRHLYRDVGAAEGYGCFWGNGKLLSSGVCYIIALSLCSPRNPRWMQLKK